MYRLDIMADLNDNIPENNMQINNIESISAHPLFKMPGSDP